MALSLPVRPITRVARRARLAVLRRHWSAFAVLLLFDLIALIVPTMMTAPVSDDWVYTRSVEVLVCEGRFVIIDLSVVTLIFQVL